MILPVKAPAAAPAAAPIAAYRACPVAAPPIIAPVAAPQPAPCPTGVSQEIKVQEAKAASEETKIVLLIVTLPTFRSRAPAHVARETFSTAPYVGDSFRGIQILSLLVRRRPTRRG